MDIGELSGRVYEPTVTLKDEKTLGGQIQVRRDFLTELWHITLWFLFPFYFCF